VSYLVVFRSYPDIDHLAPMAWKLLDEGEEVHAIVARGYDPDSDHRLALLRSYPRYREHRILPKRGGPLAEVAAFVRTTLPWSLALVARKHVRLVAVEWGYGLPEAYDRALPRRLVAVLKTLGRSLKAAVRRDSDQPRNNFVVAARLLGRRSVCLPHGLSIKLDAVSRTADHGRVFDWRDRNRFDAYVMNTAHHRAWALEHAGGDPEVFQTWGSLRWAPEWFARNREAAPPFEWPEPVGDGGVKVVLMTPKWVNRVHNDQAVSMVRRLQSLDFVSLAVKDHPRLEARVGNPLRTDPEIDFDRIHDVTYEDSVSIIRAADVIIDVGSSIGIETVMQGKTLVNPAYVHEITTLFDTIPGTCVVAEDDDAVEQYLRDHAAGRPHEVPQEAYDELLRRAVYGSRDEPFDVLDHYYRRVRGLAEGNGHASEPERTLATT
jgi:hypothetical protein